MLNLQSENVNSKVFEDIWTPLECTVTEFLKSFFQNCEGGYVNLRFTHDKYRTKNLFIPLSKIASIPSIVKAHKKYNCYIAIATRTKGNGSKEGIVQIPALLVDADIYKLSDEEKKEYRQRYNDFPLKASFDISSGNLRKMYPG